MRGDDRAQKIAMAMRRAGLDNFAAWREDARREGKFGTPDRALPFSGNLAEFIGVVLGDGNISAFPRTERLIIACDSQKPDFIARYARITAELFSKKPTVSRMKGMQCVRISIYQRGIAARLGLPTGSRATLQYRVPAWIAKSEAMLIRFLRGLYEAEGSISYHPATYTHKLLFSNRNRHLLDAVYRGLVKLRFHPHRSPDKIQLSRKDEVRRCLKLLRFRKYDIV